MIVIDENKYFEKKMEMLRFIRENTYGYWPIIPFVEDAIHCDFFLEDSQANIPATLAQLFSRFGVFKEGADPYLELYKLLENYSFLEGNVCEIAAGRYPRLAELTAPQIKERGGSLTVYEPNIIFSEMDNMTIVQDEFTKKTDINQFDTLYASWPCEVTAPIVEKAFENDKNLMLAFCSCNNSTRKYPIRTGKYWAEDFCQYYRKKYGEEAQIINWPDAVGLDTPILIRQSSKQKIKTRK